ncbi:MAG TPA: GAF domain-containing protein [Kofleriaceae bacterium]|nr:GAF domain-containing protein [Kofleriaceae bacterium]
MRSRVPDPGALCGVLAAARPAQASAGADEMCREMAALLGAEVATVYALERDGDALLVVGNVGFPHEVVGNLRLRVGDGIVGTVAACMHPIAIVAGARDPRFKSVRGIGEEDFPVLLAVPIARGQSCLGVLVFQRRSPEFADREVRLARLLAATVALALEADREAPPIDLDARPGSTLSLDGRALSGGLGLGRVEILPTAESLARSGGPAVGAAELARVEKDLARLRERLGEPAAGDLARALQRLETLISDTRFRERATGASARELAVLARDYARAPFQLAASAHGREVDQAMLERARDVEELCVLLHLAAAGSRLRDAGRVWIGSRLGAVFALAATHSAAAVVLDGPATGDAVAIARATGLPLLAEVQGLFAWTRPGDLLVVDADRALVRVNPNASELARARRAAAGR